MRTTGARARHDTGYCLPSAQQLDHTCRNTSCVNPDHLEPVTPKVNTQRSIRVAGPTCRNGHERNEANVYITPAGTRQCRQCRRRAQERYRHAA
ncbi:HNH endonuclease [Mycolicibacterium goodii]|uniref:HNH endonuclease n=1 Tax=Mycolicibacterium goodii TaxID=134601 RepID=UPI0035591696